MGMTASAIVPRQSCGGKGTGCCISCAAGDGNADGTSAVPADKLTIWQLEPGRGQVPQSWAILPEE